MKNSLNKLKQNDYDRYISTLFIEKGKIADALKLIEFNVEVAQIKNRVTEPTLGFIRSAWWREAIEEIYSPQKIVSKHHLVEALADIISRYSLEKQDFLDILSAREKDFVEEPFQTIADLKNYLTRTSYLINKILTKILLSEAPEEILDMIKNYSDAWAISALLFSANKNFAKGRNIFPKDLCTQVDLQAQSYGSKDFLLRSKQVVKPLVESAKELNNINSENLGKNLKKRLKPLLVYQKLADYRLRQIEKNDYDVFSKNYNPYLSTKALLKIYYG